MGSGTTSIEANVLGMNSAGVDISQFNCLIADIKTRKHDVLLVEKETRDILAKTAEYSKWLTKGQKRGSLFLDSS